MRVRYATLRYAIVARDDSKMARPLSNAPTQLLETFEKKENLRTTKGKLLLILGLFVILNDKMKLLMCLCGNYVISLPLQSPAKLCLNCNILGYVGISKPNQRISRPETALAADSARNPKLKQ